MRSRLMVLTLIAGVISTAAPDLAAASVEIRDSANDEAVASMDDGWLAWTTVRGVSWVRHTGARARKIMASRHTVVGSIKLDRPFEGSLWFDWWKNTDGGSKANIRRYNLVSHKVFPAPEGVNTGGREYGVTASGDFLLFGRYTRRLTARRVILYRLSTGIGRKIASTHDFFRVAVVPGQVNGDFAVFARCRQRCSIFRYQIRAEQRGGSPTTWPDPHRPCWPTVRFTSRKAMTSAVEASS